MSRCAEGYLLTIKQIGSLKHTAQYLLASKPLMYLFTVDCPLNTFDQAVEERSILIESKKLIVTVENSHNHESLNPKDERGLYRNTVQLR